MSEADEPTTELTAEPEPLIVADGLGLRTRRGWVYRDVDLAVPDDSVTALVGPAGSGRSMLLLTIAGRARSSEGHLTVAGSTDRRRIRRAVAVARVTAAAELEPELRVADHVREATLLNRTLDFPWARKRVGLDVDSGTLVADLATDDAVLLAVAIALAGRPAAIVVDDVDIAATPDQQTRIWRALGGIGVAVVASTVDGAPAGAEGATVVAMTGGGLH